MAGDDLALIVERSLGEEYCAGLEPVLVGLVLQREVGLVARMHDTEAVENHLNGQGICELKPLDGALALLLGIAGKRV